MFLMGARFPLRCFLNVDKIETLKFISSPCLVYISDGDKIPIEMFFEWGLDGNFENFLVPMLSKISDGDKTPLTYFLNGDKIEPLKIILSPCLVKISNGDKIPIDMFFGWGQDRTFENYLVPMHRKNFQWGQDPH